TGVPTLFVYDRYPGGAGFAQAAFEMIEELIEACCSLILACGCEDGCPSCVGSPIPPYVQADADGSPLGLIPDKEAALVILHDLLDRAPYVPKLPRKVRATAMGGVAPELSDGFTEEPVERKPSKPLSEGLELRLRRRLQSFQAQREPHREAHRGRDRHAR